MREIGDIIEELVKHPDYLHSEIWTKSDILIHLEDRYSDEFGIDLDLKEDLISESEWFEIEEQISNYYLNCYDINGLPYSISSDMDDLPELDLRLRRHYKINSIFI